MSDTTPTEPTGDHEYDLVHDDVPPPRAEEAPPVRGRPSQRPPDTGDYAEHDYSYDLAHEVPPPRRD